METSKDKNPSPGDIFTWKMNNSDEYQKRFLSDFTFAKQELDRAGVQISKESYEEFTNAFLRLKKVADDIFEIPISEPGIVVIFLPPQKEYEKSDTNTKNV